MEGADALIDQEYYCSFEAAILGGYRARRCSSPNSKQQGRICDVPAITDLSVHTAWDIGVDDAMAIWCFQVYPDQLDIVDYYESHGQGFDHYCEWLDKRGYHGTDWMPHDAKFLEAGAPGARTRIETLVTLGRKPELAPEQPLMDGINAARKTIPLSRFDAKALRARPRGAAILPHRVGREGQGVQEDARAQLGLSRRGRVARRDAPGPIVPEATSERNSSTRSAASRLALRTGVCAGMRS